jgi:hypothetical protein
VRLPARCRRPRPVACDRLAPHSRRRTSQGPALGGLRFPEFKRNRSNKECPIRLATNLLGRSCRGGSRAERPADRCPEQLPNCA